MPDRPSEWFAVTTILIPLVYFFVIVASGETIPEHLIDLWRVYAKAR